MSTSKTSIFVIGVVALLMACTVAGVVITNNNNTSNSDTETTEAFIVTDSNSVTCSNDCLTISNVNCATVSNSNTIYSTGTIATRNNSVHANLGCGTFVYSDDAIAINSLPFSSNSCLVVIITTSNNLTMKDSILTLRADINSAYLNTSNSSSRLMIFTDSNTLGGKLASNCFSMASLTSSASSSSSAFMDVAVTLKKVTNNDNQANWFVSSDLSSLASNSCTWTVYTDLTSSSYSSRMSTLANNISIFTTDDDSRLYSDMTTIRVRSNASNEGSATNDSTVTIRNTLNTANSSKWTVSIDLASENAAKTSNTVTMALGTVLDSLRAAKNSVTVILPDDDVVKSSSSNDNFSMILTLPGTEYSSDFEALNDSSVTIQLAKSTRAPITTIAASILIAA